jgi:hypothetical protein
MSSSSPRADARAREVQCSDDELSVLLADGRSISVPLGWFPRLLRATPSERANFELMGGGQGIHWPDIDEDVSVEGLLRGSVDARSRDERA